VPATFAGTGATYVGGAHGQGLVRFSSGQWGKFDQMVFDNPRMHHSKDSATPAALLLYSAGTLTESVQRALLGGRQC
jgi:hypothetical protein